MKRRKILCAILILCLMVVTVGCGKKQLVETQNETKKLTYWVAIPTAMTTQVNSMAELTMYKEIEKKTGIAVEFIHPPQAHVEEKFNLMIASGKKPDIVEYAWQTYRGGMAKAIDDNVIIKLNDIMEEHSPNFTKRLRQNPSYDKNAKTDAGLYPAYPMLLTSNYRVFGGIMLRGDWLEELGLSVPETVAEWETVLRAFKEKKGCEAPFTLRPDYIVPQSQAYAFNGAFNVGLGSYMQNGKVKYAPLEAGYKEFTELMRKWYSEGLLDNEFATNNETSQDAKMINGSAGACFGFIGSTMGKYLSAMQTKNPKYSLIAAQHPVLNKGDEPSFMQWNADVNPPFAAITTDCKNPEVAAKFMDYLYSDEGSMLWIYGVEGETYNMVNGLPRYTDEILKNPNGLSMVEAMSKYVRAASPNPCMGPRAEYMDAYYEQYYGFQQQKEAFKIWPKYFNNARNIQLPNLEYKQEEVDEITGIQFELSSYVSEMLIKFIQGTEPMEKYDAFVNRLKAMKAERMIEIQQGALDRYNNK